MNSKLSDYEALTLDKILETVEKFTDFKLSGFASPLASYINRVYELETVDRQRLIVKFYRPGRWSFKCIEEEHLFVKDCAADEIPVISPLLLNNSSTLGVNDGFVFALYPKRSGRWFEINSDDDWKRVGRVVARIHNAGARRVAHERVCLAPQESTAADLDFILQSGLVSRLYKDKFESVCMKIIDIAAPYFEEAELLRIHGDCHSGNLLDRPDDGIMVIDFDDMAWGPAVQDLWLLLPDYASKCSAEIDMLLRGYEELREFDDRTLKLIEPLRAMRIIYFLAWCVRQYDDLAFRKNFPDWGTDGFWRKETFDLEEQYLIIEESLRY